ncbi:MAG: polysaccharide deacetylase family protein [Fulvimarina manganoxydans]|uniref:polysaccharide deacetylase family protein n=1 Tax=Fulvimarina manganoxydans TaxID=937218 RepID=UPI002353296E|nr:polysaccharide deacetylase family protein [Fulvimarina manganoxydans]MCK5931538.1 polysaccharide deacetylase family protein [Fulvimarina manganoxydans]
MTDFSDLSRELDRWLDMGRKANLWWRDDDACRASPALTRLVADARRHHVPLALAVIPARLDGSLETFIEEEGGADVTILQHGFAHENHAAAGGRAVECGGARPAEAVMAECAEGHRRLRSAFGRRFRKVMVPPWNRIEGPVAEALPAAGYEALSVFGPRPVAPAPEGLMEVSAHLDLLTWKGGARFAGAEKLVRLGAERLEDRRLGRSDSAEPFGILTHHLDHDEATWHFLDRLLALLAAHPAVRWPSAAELFDAKERAA